MYAVLHPTYTLRLTFQDKLPSQSLSQSGIGALLSGAPNDRKFYKADSTGCDAVVTAVRAALLAAGLGEIDVTLDQFEHRS